MVVLPEPDVAILATLAGRVADRLPGAGKARLLAEPEPLELLLVGVVVEDEGDRVAADRPRHVLLADLANLVVHQRMPELSATAMPDAATVRAATVAISSVRVLLMPSPYPAASQRIKRALPCPDGGPDGCRDSSTGDRGQPMSGRVTAAARNIEGRPSLERYLASGGPSTRL
jgi:hypothetical protein